MMLFSHPAFARLSPKIERAKAELKEVQKYAGSHPDEFLAGEWGAVSAISLGIHNIYNGIEDILLSLARDIDDSVPVGSTMHQDILDQMVTEISGIRPAVLDGDLYESLSELKGFRHLVRHRYGFDLKADKIRENLDRVAVAFPAFVEAVASLERSLLKAIGDQDAGSGSGGERPGEP
jgi:uncharacterized protein YutE (UPF0331/DUF86 family)